MSDELIRALQPLVDRVRTDVTAVKGTKGMAWTKDALTPARLAKHLNGGPARGVCPIKAGESTTMVGLLDLDSHKGESTWDEMTQAADDVIGALLMDGIIGHPWRSSGGNGIHIIALWDEPQDAHSVRCSLTEALESCGYTNGTDGVAKRQIEVFPKQDSVPIDGYGNQFILPLAGKSEPLIPALGYEPGGREAAESMAWLSSVPVVLRNRPLRSVSSDRPPGDVDRLRAALAAIPNDGDGVDYDAWRDIIFAIHHATSGAGIALAHEFSSRSAKYDPVFLDERVWPYVKATGGITEATIFAKARDAGWVEDVSGEFEVIEQAREPEGADVPWPTFSRDKAGRIESTATNAQLALHRPDVTGYRLGYDEFMGRRVIARHGEQSWRPFKDSDYFEIRVQLERVGFIKPGQDLVREAVRCVAEHESFDSAVQWANSLAWDGVSRVERFFQRYLGVADTAYHRAVSVYLWTALAGRCMDPGCKVDMVPVLIGDQGSGKTSMVEAIAPTDEAFIEINLDQRNEDQMARSLRGKLVGELAELRGLAGREAEDIKAWISRRHEEIRALYAEFHTKYPRRLVMIGTGNNPEFLSDDTGERRWLPLHVGSTDLDALRADRDQLWAEGVAMWRLMGVQWSEAQTLAKGEHSAFKVRDPWEEPIEHWLAQVDLVDQANGDGRFSARDVLVGALNIADSSIKKSEEMRVCKVLRSLGFVKVEKWEQGKNRKKWERATFDVKEIA